MTRGPSAQGPGRAVPAGPGLFTTQDGGGEALGRVSHGDLGDRQAPGWETGNVSPKPLSQCGRDTEWPSLAPQGSTEAPGHRCVELAPVRPLELPVHARDRPRGCGLPVGTAISTYTTKQNVS